MFTRASTTTTRFEPFPEMHRAGQLEAAEAGCRDCLRDGESKAGVPLAALLLQQARFSEAAEVLEPLVHAAPGNVDLLATRSMPCSAARGLAGYAQLPAFVMTAASALQ